MIWIVEASEEFDEWWRGLDERNQEHVYRILYAFDPRRQAFLCLGGDKANDRRWYERNIPRAERIFAAHLERLAREAKEQSNG